MDLFRLSFKYLRSKEIKLLDEQIRMQSNVKSRDDDYLHDHILQERKNTHDQFLCVRWECGISDFFSVPLCAPGTKGGCMFRSALEDFILAKPRCTHTTPLAGICSKHWSFTTQGIHVTWLYHIGTISYRHPPNPLIQYSLYGSMTASSSFTAAKSIKIDPVFSEFCLCTSD